MRALAPWIACAAAAGCTADGAARLHTLEFLQTGRSANGDLSSDARVEDVYGLALVVEEAESRAAVDVGLRVADFAHADGSAGSDGYFEVHAGLRWYLAPRSSALRPYLGGGLVWSASGDGDGRLDYGGKPPYTDERSNWDALFDATGAYATAALELAVGQLVLSSGVRAIWAADADAFAQRSDDFASELFLGVGWRF